MVNKNRFKEFLPLLNVLRKLHPDNRSIIIDSLEGSHVNNICHCINKVLRCGSLTKKKKSLFRNRLSPYKSLIREIDRCRVSKKRKILGVLNQKGSGVLSLLLTTAIPLILDLIISKSKSKSKHVK